MFGLERKAKNDIENGILNLDSTVKPTPVDAYSRTIAQLREKRRQSRTYKSATVSHGTFIAYARQRNLDYAAFSKGHPIRYYLLLCRGAQSIVASQIFSNYILICIIVAGLLVGVQTYPQFEDVSVINWIDDGILISFSLELLLKLFSEGLGPWWFFIGPDWSWNLFDLAIVILSLPYISVVGGSNVKLLRLVRLMRLAKVFNRIERLHMIVSGLLGGLRSIFYIVVLLGLCFYLYACAGIIIFRSNDSWHFRSVEISMLTLLGVATLDSWTLSLYINFFGCSAFPGDVYSDSVEGRDSRNALGGTMLCQEPLPQPGPATAFYVSFIALSSFCILSLFISSVSAAMTDSMTSMKRVSAEGRLKRNILRIDAVLQNFNTTHPDHRSRAQARMVLLVEAAFRGYDMEALKIPVDRSFSPRALYKRLAFLCHDVVNSSPFMSVMTIFILGAAVTVGMSTDPALMSRYSLEIDLADEIILYTFVVEVVLKIIAECWHPWRYFFDGWNVFDFVVVAGSLGLSVTSNGSLVTVLRLFRLLRVLKLMRAVRELQVITAALMSGLSSMFYIIVILSIFLYFFAIVGITFLAENDPWHFGSLHMAALSLFQVATMDNWQAVMHTSLYGCLAQPGPYPELCTEATNHPQFLFASIYFVFVVLLGGLVLLTLFIGVVSMSMEEANVDARKDAEIKRRARLICDVEQLGPGAEAAYHELFHILDMTHTNLIGKREMQFALAVAGLTTDKDAIDEIWQKVDRDGSSGIDFAEFLEFMIDLRYQLKPDTRPSNPAMSESPKDKRRVFDFTGSDRSGSGNGEAGLKVKRSAIDLLSGVSATSRKNHPLHDDLALQEVGTIDGLVEGNEDASDEAEDDVSLASYSTKEGEEDYSAVPPQTNAGVSGDMPVEMRAVQEPPILLPPRKGHRPATEEASLEGVREDGEAKEEGGPTRMDGVEKKKKKAKKVAVPKSVPPLTDEQIKEAEVVAKKAQADAAIQKHYHATLHAFAAARTLVRNGRAHNYLIRPVLRDLSASASVAAGSGDAAAAPSTSGGSPFTKLGGVPWPQPVVKETETEIPVETSESNIGRSFGALMRLGRGREKSKSSKTPQSPKNSTQKWRLFSMLRRPDTQHVAAAESELEVSHDQERTTGGKGESHPTLATILGAEGASPKKVVRSLVVGV